MVKILSTEAGVRFQPTEFEHKEAVQGSRPIDLGHEGAGEEAELQSDSVDVACEDTPGLDGSPAAEKKSKEEVFEDEPKRVHNPPSTPHDPEFLPIASSEYTVSKSFSNWIVTQELLDDGTFDVLTDDAPDYVQTKEEEPSPEGIRDEILAEARAEAERLRAAAKSDGFKEGHEEGLQTAREEVRIEMVPVFEELKNSIKTILDFREQILLESEKEIFELALLFSKKVLHSELRLHPEVVLDVVRHALKRAVGWGEAIIRVNPEDLKFLEDHEIELNEVGEGVSVARIDSNPTLSRGSCILESNFGEIDIRIDKQIEAVEKSLREALDERFSELEGDIESLSGDEAAEVDKSSALHDVTHSEPGEEELSLQEPSDVRPYMPTELGAPEQSEDAN
jgi:flagellar biosynthesis/type III secretory pathway protein FliH